MQFQNSLLVVSDMERSLAFYEQILGLCVTLDFGANKTLTGGLCLQTLDTWKEFIGTDRIQFGGKSAELYFTEEDFDGFAERLNAFEIEYVHPVKEHRWGQRVVRFYDPDQHIIEVGETLTAVVRRFQNGGMTPEQIAQRMDVPIDFINQCLC